MKKRLYFSVCSMLLTLMIQAQEFALMDGTIDYLVKGDNHFSSGAYTKAHQAYEKGLKKKPGDSLTYFLRLASVNKELANYEASESYYAKSVSSDVATPKELKDYAEVLAYNEKYDEAVNWMDVYENNTSETLEERKDGFEHTDQFFTDSLMYQVRPVDFNSASSDFSASYLKDEIIFVSAREEKKALFRALDQRDEGKFLDLYKKTQQGAVVRFSEVSTSLNQGPVSYSPKLNKMFVTSNYPESVKNSKRGAATALKILMYEKTKDGWDDGIAFPYNNEAYSVAHPCFDEEADVMYFASDMPGGFGGVDLYASEYKDGEWSKPENLGAQINTSENEMFPFVDAKERVLYFSSNGYGGIGGLDVYKVSLQGDKKIVNLGYPLNSPKDDFGFVLNPNGDSGYISSDRDGGVGKDDIYKVFIKRVVVRAKLIDSKTNQPIIGNLQLINTRTGEAVPYKIEGDEVVFDGVQGENYTVLGDKDGYSHLEMPLVVPADSREVDLEVPLKPEPPTTEVVEEKPAKEKEIRAVPETVIVYFGFEDARISSESKQALSEMLRTIQGRDDLVLELHGHADQQGDHAYNLQLSKERAHAVFSFLSEGGIDSKIMKVFYYGEDELEDHTPTLKAHAANRRVEISFISID